MYELFQYAEVEEVETFGRNEPDGVQSVINRRCVSCSFISSFSCLPQLGFSGLLSLDEQGAANNAKSE
jgi:hypothetical protein